MVMWPMMCLNKNVVTFRYCTDINVFNYLLFQKIISIYK